MPGGRIQQQSRRAHAIAGKYDHLGGLKLLDAVRVVIHDSRGHAVLICRDLAHPALRAQLDAGPPRRGPIGDVGARLRPLRASRCAMAQINAARASLVIHGGDRGIGRPPVPAEPIHRLGQHRAGAAERERRHRRISRRYAGIAGEAGDPHHSVILLEEPHQGVVIDGPVVGHAIQAAHAKVGRMQSRKMRRVHHGAAAHAVEVDNLDRRVVIVDRVILGPGADIWAGRIVAEDTRLPVAARAGIHGGIHPAALLEAEDVHPRVGETPGHGGTRRAGADDQHIHGVVHAALSCTTRSMPLSALEMQCRAGSVTGSSRVEGGRTVRDSSSGGQTA